SNLSVPASVPRDGLSAPARANTGTRGAPEKGRTFYIAPPGATNVAETSACLMANEQGAGWSVATTTQFVLDASQAAGPGLERAQVSRQAFGGGARRVLVTEVAGHGNVPGNALALGTEHANALLR